MKQEFKNLGSYYTSVRDKIHFSQSNQPRRHIPIRAQSNSTYTSPP